MNTKTRHSLKNLQDIVDWINTNDIGGNTNGTWEQLHKKTIGLPVGSFLDISNLKPNGKGSKVTKEVGSHHTKHNSFNLIWTSPSAYDLYARGTGITA